MKTSPFIIVRRVLQVSFCAIAIGTATWLYMNPQVFNPITDFHQVWKNSKETERGFVAEYEVEVLAILDNQTLRVRTDDDVIFHFKLIGISTAPGAHSREAKAYLENLLLDQRITFSATITSNSRTAIGVAYHDGTNINLLLLKNKITALDRMSFKSLPLLNQYWMVRAERANRRLIKG